MYDAASKPGMLNLPRKSCIGCIVLFRRFSNHDVSLFERPVALRTLGLVEGQFAPWGVYPFGAFGNARVPKFEMAPMVSCSRLGALVSKKDADNSTR